MEYIYAAMLLHEAETEINEENVTAILEAAGADVAETRVKALVAALEDVDLAGAIASAAAMPAAAAAPASGDGDDDADSDESEAAEEAADEDEEEEEPSGEGLGSLFG